MAKIHDMKFSNPTFDMRGVVFGCKRDKFYQSGTGKSGSAWNRIKFSLKVAPDEFIPVTLMGNVRDQVYFYDKDNKTTHKVAWKDRRKFNKGRLIGVGVALERDEEDKNVNQTLTEYDAVNYMHDTLEDGMSVFIRGKIVPNSYTDKNGNLRRTNEFIISGIFLTTDEVDFDGDFERHAQFEWSATKKMTGFVYDNITKDEDGRFVATGMTIDYAKIEPIDFIIEPRNEKTLAAPMKKALKQYNSIDIDGTIVVKTEVVEEDSGEDDVWSDGSPARKKQNGPTVIELVINHAYPRTIDKEAYSVKEMEAAMAAIKANDKVSKQFGEPKNETSEDDWNDDSDWGGDDDDDELPWED